MRPRQRALPRVHRHRYFGVRAPTHRSALRSPRARTYLHMLVAAARCQRAATLDPPYRRPTVGLVRLK
jgi:hypothetical protein